MINNRIHFRKGIYYTALISLLNLNEDQGACIDASQLEEHSEWKHPATIESHLEDILLPEMPET